ncbi:RES domain-containing protein [Alkalibacterium putridalgicola]|uniref:RES domain-containing protein n=1 Tax=Alkalibacterium putridalgicola TaxID=426703 RepID=A0A1H7PSK7_9LACT|nr:RES domain-containing protein [Alkalibacterium putridalgicola]GEK88162.1 hypothetical protein APU01nite_02010 [Alkalibacterium putridalgicola]SEL38733.1 RES domain-containing protein [Alkalibacterium putridalgicola]
MSIEKYGVQLSEYLFNVEIHELLDKIDSFKKLNTRKMKRQDITNEINKVLSFDNKSVLLSFISSIPEGTALYRIRKLENAEFPNKDFKILQDAWNPPGKFVKRQRLNKTFESLLYTCFDLETAIEETEVHEEDAFALICYESIDEIKAINIGIENDYSSFDNGERLKLRILSGFLKEEFTRDVGKGKEHLYEVSEIIAKFYFDLPPRDVQDAWLYPSVANKPTHNLCLRPDIAKEKLKLQNVLIIDGYKNVDSDILINVRNNLIGQGKGFVSIMKN